MNGPRSITFRYGCAVASIALAVGVRLLLDPALGNAFPFATVFFAVLVTAWFGGFEPALAAVILGGLASDYFLLEPVGSLALKTQSEWIGMLLYLCTSLGIALLGGSMHAAQRRAEAGKQELAARVDERTKAVAASEARMAGIVGSAMDAIISVDSAQKVVLFNTAAEKLFLCPAAEAMGQPLDRFIPQRFRAHHGQQVNAFGNSGVTSRNSHSLGALSGLRADGVEFPIEASISQIAVAGEKIYTVILRDITERQQAAKASVLLTAIVDSSFDAIVGKDLNSMVTSWNAGAEKVFGYSADEMIGRSITLLIPPDRQDEEEKILSRIRRGESLEHFETVRRRKDGSLVDVSVTVSPIKDAKGQIVGASKVARDISERKKVESALRESEERLRLVLQAAQFGHWEIDPVSRTASCSDLNYRIFGYAEPFPEWSVQKFISHLHPEDRERVQGIVQNGLATQQDWEFESRIIRQDQAVRWISVLARFFQNIGGHPVRVLGICEDITGRRAAEEARRESESRYRTLFDYAPDGIVIANPEGYYLDGNPSICRMLDYAREELIGKSASDIVVPEEIQHIEPALDVIKAKSDYHREWKFRRRDGSVFNAEVIATTMPDGNILAMFRDITERKKAELELRASEQRMRLATEATGVGIWEWNLFTNQIRWDAQLFRIYGLAPTADGSSDYALWRAAVLPEDLAKQEAILQDTIRRRGSGARHYRIRRAADGEIRHLHAVETVRTNERGEAEWMVGTNLDITERKQAEAALRASEERFRLMADSAPVLIWISGPDKLCTWFNQRWMEFTGRSMEQELGNGWTETVHPEDYDRCLETYSTAFDAREPFAMDYRMRRHDGEWRKFLDTGVPRFDADRKFAGYIGSCSDITDRINAEEALRKKDLQLHATDRRLAEIIQGMTEACFALDTEWRFTFVNDQGETLLRHHREQMVGKTIWEVFNKLVGTPMEAHYRRAMTERVPVAFEVFSPIAGRWLDIRLFPTGEGLAAFLLDIQERKLAEAALEQSRTEFKDLFDNAPAGYHEVDAEGRLVRINQTELNMLGYAEAELIGRPVWKISAQEEISRQAVAEKLRGIMPHEAFERRLKRKDGSSFPVLIEDRLLRGPDGQVAGIRSVIKDITERKQAEEAIQRLNTELEQRVIERTAQLEAANKELEAFSYSVSHDLRAPLRAVNGFAGIVLEEYGTQLDEAGRRYLERIRNGGQKMGVLIDDLLAFSRLGRQAMNLQTVDSRKLVQSVLNELAPQREGREIELRVGELLPCACDPALLKQVWINLIANAIKYTRGRTPAVIEIGCMESGAGRETSGGVEIPAAPVTRHPSPVTFYVRDNGAGFDMEYAHKLFGVFQRLHRAEEFEGTGVGLAIVQRIIHRHGGRVWAERELNRGATFYFTLEGENKS